MYYKQPHQHSPKQPIKFLLYNSLYASITLPYKRQVQIKRKQYRNIHIEDFPFNKTQNYFRQKYCTKLTTINYKLDQKLLKQAPYIRKVIHQINDNDEEGVFIENQYMTQMHQDLRKLKKMRKLQWYDGSCPENVINAHILLRMRKLAIYSQTEKLINGKNPTHYFKRVNQYRFVYKQSGKHLKISHNLSDLETSLEEYFPNSKNFDLRLEINGGRYDLIINSFDKDNQQNKQTSSIAEKISKFKVNINYDLFIQEQIISLFKRCINLQQVSFHLEPNPQRLQLQYNILQEINIQKIDIKIGNFDDPREFNKKRNQKNDYKSHKKKKRRINQEQNLLFYILQLICSKRIIIQKLSCDNCETLQLIFEELNQQFWQQIIIKRIQLNASNVDLMIIFYIAQACQNIQSLTIIDCEQIINSLDAQQPLAINYSLQSLEIVCEMQSEWLLLLVKTFPKVSHLKIDTFKEEQLFGRKNKIFCLSCLDLENLRVVRIGGPLIESFSSLWEKKIKKKQYLQHASLEDNVIEYQ